MQDLINKAILTPDKKCNRDYKDCLTVCYSYCGGMRVPFTARDECINDQCPKACGSCPK